MNKNFCECKLERESKRQQKNCQNQESTIDETAATPMLHSPGARGKVATAMATEAGAVKKRETENDPKQKTSYPAEKNEEREAPNQKAKSSAEKRKERVWSGRRASDYRGVEEPPPKVQWDEGEGQQGSLRNTLRNTESSSPSVQVAPSVVNSSQLESPRGRGRNLHCSSLSRAMPPLKTQHQQGASHDAGAAHQGTVENRWNNGGGVQGSYQVVEQLLRLAQGGDLQREGELIEMLEPLLRRSCRHYFGYVDEDLLQMGRIRALELIRRFDSKRTQIRFLGYMSRFISCYYWDCKKAQLRQEEPISYFSQDMLNQASYWEEGIRQVEVRELLSSLDKEQRYVVMRNIMEGAGLKQVSQEMNLTLEQVKYLKKKALIAMRAMERTWEMVGN